jgi:hypothetical protein
MEVSIFPRPEFTRELERFVEVWLHVDTHPEYAKLQVERMQSSQLPGYLILDPGKPKEPAAVFRSLTLDSAEVLEFLRKN